MDLLVCSLYFRVFVNLHLSAHHSHVRHLCVCCIVVIRCSDHVGMFYEFQSIADCFRMCNSFTANRKLEVSSDDLQFEFWNAQNVFLLRRSAHLTSFCQFTGSCNLSDRCWLSQYVQHLTLLALHLRPSGIHGRFPSDLEFTAGRSAWSDTEFRQLIFSAFQRIIGVSCVVAFGKFKLTLTLYDYTILWSVLMMNRQIYFANCIYSLYWLLVLLLVSD